MITKLIYNWYLTGDTQTGMGEDYDVAEVGKKDTKEGKEVEKIEEHRAAGEGDKWYYDVSFIDGTEMRVFNPNTTIRKKDKTLF
jgi:hypothetical protein